MFDLEMLVEFAAERKLRVEPRSEDVVAVSLGAGLILCFENCPTDADTLIYFDDSPGGWHSHGDLFVDNESEIALVPLNILQDLLDGSLLISVAETSDGVVDISLTDSQEHYDLTEMGEGEKQTYIRVPSAPAAGGWKGWFRG